MGRDEIAAAAAKGSAGGILSSFGRLLAMDDGGGRKCQRLLCHTKLSALQDFQPADLIHGKEGEQLKKASDVPVVDVDEVLIEIEGTGSLG